MILSTLSLLHSQELHHVVQGIQQRARSFFRESSAHSSLEAGPVAPPSSARGTRIAPRPDRELGEPGRNRFSPPDGGANLTLLSNGSVLVQDGLNSTTAPSPSMFELSPQANTGSYQSGVWTKVNPMETGRLFFASALLPDGDVFVIGGEYPGDNNTAEIFDPLANNGQGSWTYEDNFPQVQLRRRSDRSLIQWNGPHRGRGLSRWIGRRQDLYF